MDLKFPKPTVDLDQIRQLYHREVVAEEKETG